MKYFYLGLIFFFCLVSYSQTTPKIGLQNNLEIANWNLEWFGKSTPGFGPDNEALQQANVLAVIKNADVDLWAFCEVCKLNVFDSMMKKLPNYDYKMCNYSQEQKLAFIYKKNLFTFIDAQLLATQTPDSFSTRRFPFSIRLKVKDSFNFTIDTLQAIVLHLKANIGSNAEKLASYNSRILSANWIRMYLNQNKNKNIIVLGDWNDDLDESIYNSLPSPFAQLLNNNFQSKFITKRLTDIQQGTTTNYNNAIDHQFITAPLYSKWVYNSTKVLKLEPYITNYSTTTSDHYPVYSYFNSITNSLKTIQNLSFKVYPNPAVNIITISNIEKFNYKISDALGKIYLQHNSENGNIDISSLHNGIYQICIEKDGIISSQLFVVSH